LEADVEASFPFRAFADFKLTFNAAGETSTATGFFAVHMFFQQQTTASRLLRVKK